MHKHRNFQKESQESQRKPNQFQRIIEKFATFLRISKKRNQTFKGSSRLIETEMWVANENCFLEISKILGILNKIVLDISK